MILSIRREKITERMLVIQIRLAMFVNDEIWIYLDKEDHLNAAQLYLLGQNIHTGKTKQGFELLSV